MAQVVIKITEICDLTLTIATSTIVNSALFQSIILLHPPPNARLHVFVRWRHFTGTENASRCFGLLQCRRMVGQLGICLRINASDYDVTS